MIPAVAQTLAELLANGTSLISTEQINFDHPSTQQQNTLRLNLYCYDLRETSLSHLSEPSAERRAVPNHVDGNAALHWFDVSFLVSAWDRTALGEQRLLSEALVLFLRHHWLPEEYLAPELRGYGNLSMSVSAVQQEETTRLWRAIAVPLRPAFCVTVTTPFNLQGVPSSSSPYRREVLSWE